MTAGVMNLAQMSASLRSFLFIRSFFGLAMAGSSRHEAKGSGDRWIQGRPSVTNAFQVIPVSPHSSLKNPPKHPRPLLLCEKTGAWDRRAPARPGQ